MKTKLGIRSVDVFPSSTGRRILFADTKNVVQIMDLETGRLSNVIETTFDMGGKRVALSDELDLIVAAAFHVCGIATYSATSGNEIWRRKDIKKTQLVDLSRDGRLAYCGNERSSLAVIDVASGKVLRTVRAAKSIHDSPYDDISFLTGAYPRALDSNGTKLFSVKLTSFAIHDVAFGPRQVCITEPNGLLRCLSLRSGAEQWRCKLPKDDYFPALGFDKQRNSFLALRWSYDRRSPRTLLRLSAEDGLAQSQSVPIKGINCCFAMNGKFLVTSESEVLDTTSGELVCH